MPPDAWNRRLRLLQFLMARPYAQTKEVADYLGISRRTALQDLKALRDHGVPLQHPSIDGGKTNRHTAWSIPDSWKKFGIETGVVERLAMLLGRAVIEHFLRDTEFARALGRIDDQVKALTHQVEEELDRRFYLKQEPAKSYGDRSEMLTALVGALVDRAPISFDYLSAANNAWEYEGERPVTLIIYRRGLYVALYQPGSRQKVVPLAVDRITNLRVDYEAEAFPYPPRSEYDPQAYFSDLFGIFDDGKPAEEVILRFPATGSAAYVRERNWMPDQVMHVTEEGAVEVRFRARGGELAFRVLEYGPFCEVVAPASLRARVARLAQETAALYKE